MTSARIWIAFQLVVSANVAVEFMARLPQVATSCILGAIRAAGCFLWRPTPADRAGICLTNLIAGLDRLRNQLIAAYAIITGLGLASVATQRADMVTKAPPPRGCVQAVDGVNGKLDGFGGEFANKPYYAGEGSLSVPLGCEWGAQLDLSDGSLDGRFIGTAAGHLFWLHPAQGLGAYGEFTHWNEFGGVHSGYVGPEGELYYG